MELELEQAELGDDANSNIDDPFTAFLDARQNSGHAVGLPRL